MAATPAFRVIAEGLDFPEGPIAMPDGSVVLVEIRGRRLTRVHPDGRKQTVAETGGGPNGAAIGPDGRCYICNNGGFEWAPLATGGFRPVREAYDYSGGRIEAVDLESGAVEVLYRAAGDIPLRGPNDIVFDREGGFWFTDLGKVRDRDWDRGAVFYATADGRHIVEAAFPLITPNGIGLSPDERTLYVAETATGRIWAFEIEAPGVLRKASFPSPHGGRLHYSAPGFRNFDSLAVDGEGHVCVATLMEGGITAAAPSGGTGDFVPLPDPFTTNICFGGPDLKTAYVTQSSAGRLLAFDWPRPGLPLNFLNR